MLLGLGRHPPPQPSVTRPSPHLDSHPVFLACDTELPESLADADFRARRSRSDRLRESEALAHIARRELRRRAERAAQRGHPVVRQAAQPFLLGLGGCSAQDFVGL
jgi:hypothetical protein